MYLHFLCSEPDLKPRNVGNKHNAKIGKRRSFQTILLFRKDPKNELNQRICFVRNAENICWIVQEKTSVGQSLVIKETQALRCLSHFSDLKIRAETGIPKRHSKICRETKDKKQDPNPRISDLTSLKFWEIDDSKRCFVLTIKCFLKILVHECSKVLLDLWSMKKPCFFLDELENSFSSYNFASKVSLGVDEWWCWLIFPNDTTFKK